MARRTMKRDWRGAGSEVVAQSRGVVLAARDRGSKDRKVRQGHSSVILRGCKRGESKARPRHNRRSQIAVHSSQFAGRSSQYAVAVAVCKLLVTLLDAVANQTLALRGNKCLDFVEVQKGIYTKVCDYVPSDPKHIQDILLYFPTSSCANRTHPCWRATAMWPATNRDLRSRRRVDF